MTGEGEEHSLPVIFGKSNCPEFTRNCYRIIIWEGKDERRGVKRSVMKGGEGKREKGKKMMECEGG